MPALQGSQFSFHYTEGIKMVQFIVQDMTCGHCASSIRGAIKAADADAKVDVDVAARCVHIDAPTADASELEAAIRAAGYTPVLRK